MRRRWITAMAAGLMTVAMTMNVFAGQWQQDIGGWWYQSDNGSYLKDGWNWVDGKCYYFNNDGYCLQNAQTPDGYTVDAGGAWIVDGVVQTQKNQEQAKSSDVQFDNISFTVPDGFEMYASDEQGVYFANADASSVICILSESLSDFGEYADLIYTYQGRILDLAMEQEVGTPQSKTESQFATGTWYCYHYMDASALGIPGFLKVYTRIIDNRVQMVMFAGAISSLDTNGIMNNCLR